MYMSAEDVAVCNACTFGLIMRKNKRPALPLTADALNICLGIPCFGQYIVVANDELNIELGKIVSPFQKQFHFLIDMTVKKIAHNDQLFGFKILHLGSKPLYIFFKNSLRHCNAVFAVTPPAAAGRVRGAAFR